MGTKTTSEMKAKVEAQLLQDSEGTRQRLQAWLQRNGWTIYMVHKAMYDVRMRTPSPARLARLLDGKGLEFITRRPIDRFIEAFPTPGTYEDFRVLSIDIIREKNAHNAVYWDARRAEAEIKRRAHVEAHLSKELHPRARITRQPKQFISKADADLMRAYGF